MPIHVHACAACSCAYESCQAIGPELHATLLPVCLPTSTSGGPSTGLAPSHLLDRSALSWGVIAYSSLGPGAAATFLQTRGQVSVPPAQAQVRGAGLVAVAAAVGLSASCTVSCALHSPQCLLHGLMCPAQSHVWAVGVGVWAMAWGISKFPGEGAG